MSKRGDQLYLQDIFDSLLKIENYTNEISYEKFVSSDEKIDAVVRNLEVIGEAAKNVSSDIQKTIPEIPWKSMIEMRNKVLHEYFGVDIEILWKTLKDDLPV